jgi:hypothetical protein
VRCVSPANVGAMVAYRDLAPVRREPGLPVHMPLGVTFGPGVAVGGLVRPVPDVDRSAFGDDLAAADGAVADEFGPGWGSPTVDQRKPHSAAHCPGLVNWLSLRCSPLVLAFASVVLTRSVIPGVDAVGAPGTREPLVTVVSLSPQLPEP